MAAAILAIAVAAVVMPFTCGVRTQDIESRQTLATSLAAELMEEIILKPFEEPSDGDELPEPVSSFGPESNELTRSSFSAMDDYDGYEEKAGHILDPSGHLITDEAAVGLSRRVSVEYVYVTGQDTGEPPSFMRVVVVVCYNDMEIFKLTRLVHWIH